MTIRELRAAGYEFQDTYSNRTDAMIAKYCWERNGYAAEIMFMPLRGNYQLWVR